MNKNIYSIKLKAVLENNTILECRKVGDAINTENRLKQHENAVTPHLENMLDLPIQGRRDYHVHEILKDDPKIVWDGEACEGYFSGREVFYMKDGSDPSYIDEIVSLWASGKKDFYTRNFNYLPYKRQQKIIDTVFAMFITGNAKVLIEAAPRTGKSFIALCIAKKLNLKKILIFTPFPDADGSFKEVILRHQMFPGASFNDARSMDKIKFSDDKEKTEVIMMSWMLLDDNKDKLNHIFNSKVDIIIVDETHRQADTERSETLIKKINHKYELHLSGTPYNDKLSGRFDKTNTVTYDFIDRMLDAYEAKKMLLKKLSKEDKKLYEFLAQSPQIKFLMIDGMNEAVKQYKEKYPNFSIEDNLTLEKFFDRKYEPIVKIFFRNLNITIDDPLKSTLMTGEFKNEFNHVLMFVPSRESADFIKRIIEELVNEKGGWAGYKVFSLSGIEDIDNYKSVENFVNNNQEKYGKTVHISVGKATTGVTLDRLSSVWMLRTMKSAELFVQASLRVGTGFSGKENVNIVCFDSEQTLTAQAIMAQMRARTTGESLAEIVKTLNKCLPTLIFDGVSFTSINGDQILAFSRDIFSNMNIDKIELLDDIDYDVLIELAQFAGLDKEFEKKIGLGGQKGGKTNTIEINNPVTNKKEKVEKEVNEKEQIIYILNHLDHIMILDESICKVEDITNLDQRLIGDKEISKKTWIAIVNAVGQNVVQTIIDQMRIKLF